MSSEDPQQPPPCRLPSVLWGEQRPGACLCAEAGEAEGLSSNPNILADKPQAPWSPAAHPSLGGDEPQLHRRAPTCPISPHPALETIRRGGGPVGCRPLDNQLGLLPLPPTATPLSAQPLPHTYHGPVLSTNQKPKASTPFLSLDLQWR